MTKVNDVVLELGNRSFTVGVVSDEYIIGGSKKGRQSVPIYDERIVPYIAEMCRRRVRKKFDARILITGPVRTGKSTLACLIARELNPFFTPDLVAFELDDFTEVLSRLPSADPTADKFPVAVLDESGTALYSKDWQTKMVKQMAKVYQIIGKKNLTMIMCLPHKNLLSKDIREQMHIWICTKPDLEGERGFAELREGVENIWQLELYWKPICGFCFPEMKDEWWSEYERLKDEFIDRYVQESKDIIIPSKVQDAIRQRNIAIKIATSEQKLSQEDIAAMLGITPSALTKIARSPTVHPGKSKKPDFIKNIKWMQDKRFRKT